MTPWIKRISLSLILFLSAAGLFSLLSLLLKPERLQASLAAEINERLGARFLFQDSKVLFRPLPILWLKNPRLEFESAEFSDLAAQEARFSFRLLPLLWGRIQVSGFLIREGKGAFRGIPFEKINFKVKGLNARGPAPFELKGGLSGAPELFEGKGALRFSNRAKDLFEGLELEADAGLHPFSFTEDWAQGFLRRFPFMSRSGEWEGKLHVEKKTGKSEVRGATQFQASHFQFGTSPDFPANGEAEFLWKRDTDSVELRKLSLKTPFGEVGGTGLFGMETGEIKEARLDGRKVVLEELARHFPNLRSFLPLDLGFSGESEFDLTLQGTWDYLSLHANLNLAPAVLTYGKIFSKPKDFPMGISLDFLLKRGDNLSGDFSIRGPHTTVKGALTNLNLKSGSGELTLLTNKFDLKEWGPLLTPFSHYQISGSAKVLLNCKGNLSELPHAFKIANLTLEDVTLLSPTGRGIEKANALIDISSLSLRIKNTSFELGNSSVQMDTELYWSQSGLQGKVQVTSPQLNLFASLDHLQNFAPLFSYKERLASFEKKVEPFLPKPFTLQDFSLHLTAQKNKITIQDLKFQLWDGSLNLKGEAEWPAPQPRFWLEAQMERISLARYFEGIGETEKVLEGNLFFAGRFQGKGNSWKEISETLTGQGNLSVTNGEWHSLDFASSLTELEPFKNFSLSSPPSLPFYDLKAAWRYENGKFDSRDLIINSQDFWIDGEGELSAEGVMNSRFDVYLSSSLTEKVFDSGGMRRESEGKQLGPIPYLAVGSFKKPELRIDEHLIESFLEAYRMRKFRKILHKPFMESRRT